MSTDLFGNEDQVPEQRTENTGPRAITGDMDEVQRVLRIALDQGFVTTGRRIWRRLGNDRIEPVSRRDEDVVHQLLDARWLDQGGGHVYYYRASRIETRSLLVSKQARQSARHWVALKRLAQPARTIGGR